MELDGTVVPAQLLTDLELAEATGSRRELVLYAGYILGNSLLAALRWIIFMTFQGIFLFSKLSFMLGSTVFRIAHSFLDGVDSVYELLVKIVTKIYRFLAVGAVLAAIFVFYDPWRALSLTTGTEIEELKHMTFDVVLLELTVLLVKFLLNVVLTTLALLLRGAVRYLLLLPARVGAAISMIFFDGEFSQTMAAISIQWAVRQVLGGYFGGIFEGVFGGLFGEAYVAAGELANRLDVSETLFSVTVGKVKRILDSGATTNLVSQLDEGETVVGTRSVNGALDSGTTQQLTSRGNILNASVQDELFSMGKFVAGGGQVLWNTRGGCQLFDQLDDQVKLLCKADVVRYCPHLTAEDAAKVKQVQNRLHKAGEFIREEYVKKAGEKTGGEQTEISPSLILLHERSRSFDNFYRYNAITDELIDDLLNDERFSAEDLRRMWDKAEGPTSFSEQVRRSREMMSMTSESGGEPNETEQHSDEAFELFRTVKVKPPKQASDETIANARKPSQKRTSWRDQQDFLRKTKGSWVIFGDIHFVDTKGYEGSTAMWVFKCTRLRDANDEEKRTNPNLSEVVDDLEVSYAVPRPDAQGACSALRWLLESLGIWSEGRKERFYFESEHEGSTDSEKFQEYLLSVLGSQHFATAGRHPGKEGAVHRVIKAIRLQLQNRCLPTASWPSVVRSHAAQAMWDRRKAIGEAAYRNRTFEQGYSASDVGRFVYAFVPSLKRRSLQPRQVPGILLHCAPRNRVAVLHAVEGTNLGFRISEVDYGGVRMTGKNGFEEQVLNLQVKRFLIPEFKIFLALKRNERQPKRVNCDRCARILRNHGQQKLEKEDGERPRGHTLDGGCMFQTYNVFEHVEFDVEEVRQVCSIAEMLERLSEREIESEHEMFRRMTDQSRGRVGFPGFERTQDPNSKQEFERLKRLENVFSKEYVLHKNWGQGLSAEDAATTLHLAQPWIRESLKRTAKEWADRNQDQSEQFCALVIPNSVVQASIASCPSELELWLAAAEKELRTLIERGVLKLVKLEELDGRKDIEVIPSLCVWSRKDAKNNESGIRKARLVACGNFQQTPVGADTSEVTGFYASTASLLSWRSLLTVYSQARGSAACIDIKEAFTQTDKTAKDSKKVTTYLRLPSQWKTLLLPSILEKVGTGSTKGWLLEVLSSIYGEASAPMLWKETLERVLSELGFVEHELEEGVFVRVSDRGISTQISTYVDDLWVFSFDPAEVCGVLKAISDRLHATKAEWLFGPPKFMFEGEKREEELSKEEKCLREVFLPLKGSYQWAVARKESSLAYVGINVYFNDDGTKLILSQEEFIKKSVIKLKGKGLFRGDGSSGTTKGEEDAFVQLLESVKVLRQEDYNHLWLFEETSENRPLDEKELTLLRSGVNTLSYAASSTRYDLQSALGQIARGQSKGRLRHLTSLRKLVGYANVHRAVQVEIEVPTYFPKIESTKELKLWISCDFDSSMGMTSALGTDGHARQGFMIYLGLSRDHCACVYGRSTLQATIALSTCEAELTACSFAAKNVVGLMNVLKLCFPGSTVETPTLHGDNQAANRISAAQAGARNMRHLGLPDLWIRNLTRSSQLKIADKRSALNTADLLTKVLPQDKVNFLLPLAGLVKP